MGRKTIEEINGSTMHTLDGVSIKLPIKKLPGTGTGTPSTPSAEDSSGNLTGGSDTGSGSETGETGSGETGNSEPTMTYGDLITGGYEKSKESIGKNYASWEQFWNGYLANAESSNAKEREAAEQRAETERQRGVIDGQASYDFNKATYGNQAEALRSMGLSGSGYADYLTSRAYATQRAEVQEANAQAATAKREAREAEARANATAKETANKGIFDAKVARDSALADAEASYLEGMLKFEENKDITYKTLIEAAASGTYSPEVLTRMAQEAGLDESQITDITTAATNAINEKNSEKDESAQNNKNTAYIELLGLAGEGKYSNDLLKEIATATGLGETEIAKILEINSSTVAKDEEEQQEIEEEQEEQKYTENYYYFKDGLLNGTATPDDVEDALDDGLISQPEYDKLKEKYNKAIDTSTNAFKKDDGSFMSREEALFEWENVINNDPWLDEPTKKAFKKSFDEKYTAHTDNGLKTSKGGDLTGDGYNIWFEKVVDGDTKEYKVEFDGKIRQADNSDIYSATTNISNGTVFAYDDKLYYKAGGTIYKLAQVPVEKRLGSGSGYARLCKLFGITG